LFFNSRFDVCRSLRVLADDRIPTSNENFGSNEIRKMTVKEFGESFAGLFNPVIFIRFAQGTLTEGEGYSEH
jgi:hypothetical protein